MPVDSIKHESWEEYNKQIPTGDDVLSALRYLLALDIHDWNVIFNYDTNLYTIYDVIHRCSSRDIIEAVNGFERNKRIVRGEVWENDTRRVVVRYYENRSNNVFYYYLDNGSSGGSPFEDFVDEFHKTNYKIESINTFLEEIEKVNNIDES